MFLFDLPPHILDSILTSSNITFMVIALYKCGSSALNYNFSQGGCTSVYLEDKNVDSMSRWPKMITTLRRLRVLRIDRCGYMATPDIFSVELQKLPPTLTELSLKCEGAVLSCLASTGPTTPESSPPTPPTGWPESRLWNMGRLFPQLQTLILMDWIITFTARPDFSIQDISVLPPTVTTLALGIENNNFNGSLIEKLLPELQSLEMFFMNEIDVWPASLTRISGFSLRSRSNLDALTAKLPRGLKGRLLWPFSPSIAAALPPALEEMDITGRQSIAYQDFERLGLTPWTRTLPARLTKLTVYYPLTAKDISSLPKTLIKVLFGRIAWETFAESIGYQRTPENQFEFSSTAQVDLSILDASARALWPNIKELEIVTPATAVKCLDWLPKSLTSIRPLQLILPPLFNTPIRIDEILPSLTDLHLKSLTPVNYSLIHLPPLTTLFLSNSIRFYPSELHYEALDEDSMRLLETNLPKLDDAHCLFKPSLRVLSLRLDRPIDINAIILAGALPSTLEELHIESDQSQVPSSICALLPPALTSLGIIRAEVSSDIFELMPCVGLRSANLTLNPISRSGLIALSERFPHLHHLEPLPEAPEDISLEEVIELWPKRTMSRVINAGMFEAPQWRNAVGDIKRQYKMYPDPRLLDRS